MDNELINIIIRTSNRPALFKRCYESVKSQVYPHIRIVIGYDKASALDYIPKDCEKVFVYADTSLLYYYDLYINHLKWHVKEGWFLFLDDDDFLHSPTVLLKLVEHLTADHEAIICQFLRNGVPKPSMNYIRKRVVRDGHIGMPSLVLRSEHAGKLYLDGYKSGDYRAIEKITQQVKTKFIELAVVETDRRSHGLMELSEKTENIK